MAEPMSLEEFLTRDAALKRRAKQRRLVEALASVGLTVGEVAELIWPDLRRLVLPEVLRLVREQLAETAPAPDEIQLGGDLL